MTLVYHVRSLSHYIYISLLAIFEEMARATKLANENEKRSAQLSSSGEKEKKRIMIRKRLKYNSLVSSSLSQTTKKKLPPCLGI